MKLDNLIQDEAFRLSMLYREIETEIIIEIARMIKNNGYIKWVIQL